MPKAVPCGRSDNISEFDLGVRYSFKTEFLNGHVVIYYKRTYLPSFSKQQMRVYVHLSSIHWVQWKPSMNSWDESVSHSEHDVIAQVCHGHTLLL